MSPKPLQFWAALAFLAAACGSALPSPTPTDVALASKRWPDASAHQLEQGRSLYARKCASCHALKTPEEVPPEQWSGEVADMRARKGVQLSDAEADAIVRYLWAVGTRLHDRPVAAN